MGHDVDDEIGWLPAICCLLQFAFFIAMGHTKDFLARFWPGMKKQGREVCLIS
jgi:hypothetical protein